MNITIREHSVSATLLEVILTGIQKHTIKLPEFDNKFKPVLLTIEGVTSVQLTSGYGNVFEILTIHLQKGSDKFKLASKINIALGQILDLNIQHQYRETSLLDYL